DGVVDPGEQCDDGNTVPGDGCDGKCQLESGIECCVDADGDGWAAIAFVTDPDLCVALLPVSNKNTQFGPCGPGGAPVALDCEDGDPAINPGVPEIPGNAVDENCNYSSFCGSVPGVSASPWTAAAAFAPFVVLVVLRRRGRSTHGRL
ncbi:MAG: hypothetical protein KC466_00695, partial [Myxococcales bacterium]|nr:hypothetical protein [Myxococcales bacterium]